MKAYQHKVSIKEFANAMLELDSGFSDRVRQFEKRFGAADADTLAVLAQAAYFQWCQCEYQNDFVETCRAIGIGKPTSFFLCFQLTPERWVEINTYVVGVQRWLGIDLPTPSGINEEKIDRIGEWLGVHYPAKEALAELFLRHLVEHILNTHFAKMGGYISPMDKRYADFTQWYPHYACLYSTYKRNFLTEKRKQCISHEMSSAPEDADELIKGILRESRPPCHFRFTRYLDIQLSSIGVLKWRGNLPLNDLPKEKWMAFLDEARDVLKAWLDGVTMKGELTLRLHEELGKPTEQSKAIVRNFLLAEERGSYPFWKWLIEKAKKEGITARFFLELSDEGR